jgi:hypothetical protein
VRSKSAQATAILANPSHQARAMACVYSSAGVAGPTWGSGAAEGNADPVLKVDVEQGIDSFRTARVTLQRQFGLYSLAPLVSTGNPLYSTEPPIAVGRRIVITAELTMPDSSLSTSTETIFDGYIDEVTWPEDDMLLVCTDKSAKLRDTWIETERVYCFAQGANATKGCIVWRDNVPPFALNDLALPSDAKFNGHFYKATAVSGSQAFLEPVWPTGTGATVVSGGVTFTEAGLVSDTTGTALETLIQQVLNDNGLGSLVTLQTPVSPTWFVKPFLQQRESVMDAIQAMVDQLGWWVRFEWNTGLSKYELTLAQPNRTSSTTHKTLLADEEIECSDLSVDLWSIRNVIRVLYGATGNRDAQGNPLRITLEVSDSASIAKYGRRFMEVAEGGSSAIDTSTEATRFAQGILDDLKEPTIGLGLSFPCDFYLELGDRIAVPADGLRFTAPQTLAVESLKHSFEANGARTSVTLRGAPAARREEWLTYDGLVNKGDVHQVSMHNTTGIGAAAVAAGAIVGGGRIQVTDTRSKKALLQAYEYHLSKSSGFTPDSTTLIAAGEHRTVENTQLIPGKTYYSKVIPWARNASRIVRASPSAEVSFVAGRASAGHLDSQVIAKGPPNGKFQHALDDLSQFPPDHWTLIGGAGWLDSLDYFWASDGNVGRYLSARLPGVGGPSGKQLQSGSWPIPRGVARAKFFATVRPQGTLSAGRELVFDFDFYAQETLVTSVGAASLAVPYNVAAANVWADYSGDIDIPAGANFVRMRVYKGNSSSAYGFDFSGLYFEPSIPLSVPGWTGVTYQNSFTDYSAGTHVAVGYTKDQSGFVRLRGLAKRATVALNTALFTLPAGYRPPAVTGFPVVGNGRHATLEIDSGGVVRVIAADDANWSTYIMLEGINFDTRA